MGSLEVPKGKTMILPRDCKKEITGVPGDFKNGMIGTLGFLRNSSKGDDRGPHDSTGSGSFQEGLELPDFNCSSFSTGLAPGTFSGCRRRLSEVALARGPSWKSKEAEEPLFFPFWNP